MIDSVNTPHLYTPGKPVRDAAYLKFVRSLPCLGCGRRYGVEAAHTGPHGLSQKASDLSCIPLCRYGCHRAFDRNPRGFAGENYIDVPAVVKRLNQFWQEKLNGGKAA